MEKTKKTFKWENLNIFKKIHFDKSNIVHRLVLLGIILVLCVILEFFVFSFKAIMTDEDEYLQDFSPLLNDTTIELSKNKDYNYVFEYPGNGIYSIRIGSVLKQDPDSLAELKKDGITDVVKSPITLKVYGYDDKNENRFWLLATHYIIPEDEVTYQYIDMNLNTEPDTNITLAFSGVTANTVIEEIVINPSDGMTGINPFRMMIFMVIGLLFWGSYVFNFNRDLFDIKRRSHKAVAIGTLIGCVFITAYLSSLVRAPTDFPNYPLDNVAAYNPYVQQFDAFLKGQLHIDVPVPDALLQLDNPYDCTQRDGISYLWDRAMYDGKYYSYFGIGPIINIYLPFYMLTGTIIADVLVTTFYAIIATAATVLFILAYVIIYKKRVRVSFIPISCVSVTLSSGIILMVKTLTPFYYIAVLGALAYLMMFLLFLLLAVNCKHKIWRPVLFGLSGLSYAFLFITRLNIAVIGAIIVIPVIYFCIVKGKRGFSIDDDEAISRSTKEKIIDVACLGSFVLISIVFSLIYNYLRFDSFFEFGTNYQLTVSDVSQNGFSFDRIPQMMYHTLFQPLNISGNFPYFTPAAIGLGNYGGYVYIDSNFGLFAIPLCLGIFMAAFVLKSKKKTYLAKALTVSVLISIVLICFLNFYLGGATYRYTTDMTLIACVASVMFMISFNESIEGTDGYSVSVFLQKVFLLASAFVCFMMLISYAAPFNKYDAGLFKSVYQMFE